MELVQSAMAVTIIGKRVEAPVSGEVAWFTYGSPLVGNEVRDRADEIASVSLIYEAMKCGIVHRVWPVGSSGILEEVRLMIGMKDARIETVLDSLKSAGPSTVVLLAIPETKINEAATFFGRLLNQLLIIT